MVEHTNSRVIMVFSIWCSTMKYMAKTFSKSQKIKQFLEKEALSIYGKVPVCYRLELVLCFVTVFLAKLSYD